MHAVYLLYAVVSLVITAAVIFGLRIRHKRRDLVSQAMRDEKIRLTIIQTEAHAVHEQTRKFEELISKKQGKPQKR